MNLADFLWNKFPDYFSDNDINKDGNNQGTFQRYIRNFGMELDENIITNLESFINNRDPLTVAEYLIPNLAYEVGTPDDVLLDENKYRDLLVQIISIYQLKGTFRSYKMLFQVLGMTVRVTEKFLDDNQYDTDKLFDDGVTIYDNDMCSATCIHYDLCYDNLPGETVAPLTGYQATKLRSLIHEIIEPHSAELDNLTFGCAPPVIITKLTFVNNSIYNLDYYMIRGGVNDITQTLLPGNSFDTDWNTINLDNNRVQFVPGAFKLSLSLDGVFNSVQDFSTNGKVFNQQSTDHVWGLNTIIYNIALNNLSTTDLVYNLYNNGVTEPDQNLASGDGLTTVWPNNGPDNRIIIHPINVSFSIYHNGLFVGIIDFSSGYTMEQPDGSSGLDDGTPGEESYSILTISS